MIDIVQWRSRIGVFNASRGSRPSTTSTSHDITHGSITHTSMNTIIMFMINSKYESTFVLQYFNISLTALYIYLDCPLVISIITIVSLLIILLAGDVETNPGPVSTGL